MEVGIEAVNIAGLAVGILSCARTGGVGVDTEGRPEPADIMGGCVT